MHLSLRGLRSSCGLFFAGSRAKHFQLPSSSSIPSAALILPSFIVATSLSGVGFAQTIPLLATHHEVQDGTPEDIACQYDCSVDPFNQRAWIAQGRVRLAIRASTRERMHLEDRSFSSSVAEVNNERIIAVEVDDLNGGLYTLTEAGLYRQSIAGTNSPANPGAPVFLDLRSPTPPPCTVFLQNWEEVRDLELYPADNMAFVLTSKRVIAVRHLGASLCVQGQALDMFDPGNRAKTLPAPHCGGGPWDLEVDSLERLRVFQDQNGRVMAYVTARMRAYDLLVGGRPIPNLIVACDLDSPGAVYQNPTFDLDPGIRIHYAWWNPIDFAPTVPPASGKQYRDWSITGCDVQVRSPHVVEARAKLT